MSDTTAREADGEEHERELQLLQQSPALDWDFEALNDHARQVRQAARASGVEGVMSQLAGEAVWLVPTDRPANPSGPY